MSLKKYLILTIFSQIVWGQELKLNKLQDALYRGALDAAETCICTGRAKLSPPGRPYDLPIQIAVRRGYVNIIRLLVRKGIHINACFSDGGYTVLHVAALFDQADSAEVLLELGANRHITNNRGDTACDIAMRHSSLAVVPLVCR
jgi:ankyrin repeat protein